MTTNTEPRFVVEALCDAMNARDYHALSQLFTDDAEFVSINGARLHGRDAIAAGHARVFSRALADSQVSLTNVDTMRLDRSIVVCHAEWSRFSLAEVTPEITPTSTGVFTLVLREIGGDWRIVAATNVQNVT